MCDLSQPFRLCTCTTDAPPDWTLHRRIPSDEQVRGITLASSLTDDAQLQLWFALDALAAGQCFDFDYVPASGDLLVFHHAEGDLRLRFADGDWCADGSDPDQGERWILHRGRIAGGGAADP